MLSLFHKPFPSAVLLEAQSHQDTNMVPFHCQKRPYGSSCDKRALTKTMKLEKTKRVESPFRTGLLVALKALSGTRKLNIHTNTGIHSRHCPDLSASAALVSQARTLWKDPPPYTS